MHTVFLSLGTNLGDKEQNLKSAINEIAMRIGPVMAQSAFVETEPWGFESENMFVNAAVKVGTALSPLEVLTASQQIERDLGRNHKSVNGIYHDRLIDIDILLYYKEGDFEDGKESISINTPELTIPHPHMHERDFVQIPLKQILPQGGDKNHSF